MGAEAQQDGREICIGRQNDKFIEPRWMVHRIQNIHRHQNIGAVLAARGQGRAINNCERRAGEEASLAAECCRVQVTIADQHPARNWINPVLKRCMRPGFQPIQPESRALCKRICRPAVKVTEGKVHIVEIDEQCGSDRFWRVAHKILIQKRFVKSP